MNFCNFCIGWCGKHSMRFIKLCLTVCIYDRALDSWSLVRSSESNSQDFQKESGYIPDGWERVRSETVLLDLIEIIYLVPVLIRQNETQLCSFSGPCKCPVLGTAGLSQASLASRWRVAKQVIWQTGWLMNPGFLWLCTLWVITQPK